MSFNPILDTEIETGAPVDHALLDKVQDNFANHEMRLVNEELDVDLVRAYQIVIDDVAQIFDAGNIEDALQEVMAKVNAHDVANQASFQSNGSRISTLETRADDVDTTLTNHNGRIANTETAVATLDPIVSDHGTRLSSAEGTISTHTSQIAALTGRVSTNESDITSLKSRATTSEANIGTNTTNISGLTTRMGTAESNITSLQGTVSTNGTRLTTAEGNITNLQGRMTTAEGSITNLQGRMTSVEVTSSGNSTRLTTLESGNTTISGNKTINGNLTVAGNFEVQGTLSYINATNLEVRDNNILLNKTGTDGSALNSGIDIERPSGNAAIRFDDTLTSKFKVGLLTAMYEVVVSGIAQTISGIKTFVSGIKTDTVSEATTNAGVTVAGVNIKNGLVAGRNVATDGATLDTTVSTVSTNGGRLTTLEGTVSTNGTRLTTLEGTVNTTNANLANNTATLSNVCVMLDKANFISRCVVNTGTLPVYVAAPATNAFGVGTLQSTTAAQEVLYNTFMPVGPLLGQMLNAILMGPAGTTFTVGLRCYNASQALISNVTITTSLAGNGAPQLVEGHFINEGVAATNFPTGTRFVKPYISWTGNTGTVQLGYLSSLPMGYARYALLG
jgi:hypothetical protein